MSAGPNRLAADVPHGLGGAAIDRSKPLKFKLNGRTITGFTGDTLLSAALGSGIQVAGRQGEDALALDESFAPLVTTGRGAPLPMDRTPALDGLILSSIGQRRDPIASTGLLGALRNRIVGPGRTLNHRFGATGLAAPPWISEPAEQVIEADFAIVGGGVSGLSAAASAVAAGKSAVLIERTPHLGGNIRYFGTAENETTPDETITRLTGMLDGKGKLTTLTRADAFAIAGNMLRVHQVVIENDRPRARVIAVKAGHIVIATGAIERLPLFPGNRTPGVTGALAAFNRAERYGVWTGRRTLFTTPQSYPYRLALHAADAGVEVQRIIDSRLTPASRFIDFAKAMGITLASALVPSQAVPVKRNEPELLISFAVALEGITHDSSSVETDQLVAAGAWQPDLQLWLRAGGASGWDDTNGWLAPRNRLPQLSITGSAAGLRTTAAAIASGRAAVLEALGKPAPPVIDEIIEAAFETPDAATSIAPFRPDTTGNTYLDRGASLVTRRAAAASKHGVSGIAIQPVQLSLGDIAAAVDIGAVARRDAGPVAAERCAVSGEINDTGWRVPVAPAADAVPPPPPYLAGRFGDKVQIWLMVAADARNFTPGCLVFTRSDITDPAKAVGVVYAQRPAPASGGIAILAQNAEGDLFIRDAGTAVAARLVERVKVG
ncbi:MAG: NAD(P)-binding protein [Devosia sp.]